MFNTKCLNKVLSVDKLVYLNSKRVCFNNAVTYYILKKNTMTSIKKSRIGASIQNWAN